MRIIALSFIFSMLANYSWAIPSKSSPPTPLASNSKWLLSTGYFSGTTDELVLVDEYSEKLSHLIWKTYSMPVFQIAFSSNLNQYRTIHIESDIGYGGNHHMTDYDYDWPTLEDGYSQEIVDYDWQSQYEWTDRSIHPNTRLTHYHKFKISTEKPVYKKDNYTISHIIGLNLCNRGWTAYGGEAEYWDGSITSTANSGYIMNFDTYVINNNQKCITLETSTYTLSYGPAVTIQKNDLYFKLYPAIGVTLPVLTDLHHLRDLLYRESYNSVLTYSFYAIASKKITKNTSLIFQAQHEVLPMATGLSDYYIITTNEYMGFSDTAAMKIRSTTLSLGIRYIA